MKSINTRITIGAGLVLAVFIALSVFALERAFRDSARSARQERLLAQIYLLMAVADVGPQGAVSIGDGPTEPRLDLPRSGLYAWVVDERGMILWRSRSSLALSLPPVAPLPPAERRFAQQAAGDGQSFLVQSFGVTWNAGEVHHPLTFAVAEDLAPFQQQLNIYRRSLWTWLGAMGALLLAAQWVILRWGLLPLRKVARDLSRLEQGDQHQLSGTYPEELTGLTENLNAVLRQERAQRKRYRDALADLAHSMKTPLALLRGTVREANPNGALSRALDEQIDRMDRLVAYHLRRAEAAGRAAFGPPISIEPMIERVARALSKVYADKGAKLELEVEPGAQFKGDEGDLTEMLGNLLDNAYKWCGSRIRVTASANDAGLILRVEDDGAGLSTEDAQRVLQRGARADQTVPGQGIGLAVTRDIVEAHEGRIVIERSELGGAAVTLLLPHPGPLKP